MKVLLLGKDGQVGWELQRSLAPLGQLLALNARSQAYCGDLANLPGLAKTVRAYAPDIIVNAAAYTAVDKAESDREQAFKVNAEAVRVLAHAAADCGALLVHYSTDYVFAGQGTQPWREDDAVAPLNTYGESKLAGEQAIQAAGCQHLILRTSWVYAARGNNFAKTMLRLAVERDSLGVIDDQHGAPTGAELIADITAHAITATLRNPALAGLYHLAASGETSWCGYARYVLQQAAAQGVPLKAHAEQVKPLTTAAYPTPARRPANSRLDTRKLQKAFALTLPDWRLGVARMLAEIHEKGPI
ncbi:TPA: dTDP-4-dehydrorhamnose reductase [Pseudomonas putida]|uniref:dTDP-4-dehydrorhamnose reductase n=1 Tax=Pseudomonas putida TaxID=303 RepID=UPI001047C167|nr:dTDP-4-dehydrorhamnose reductase [Pseudomonas putida]MCS4062635.1 dTDP-4-dehydrorhamnose reductase [Pseudomonas putida]MDD1993784.1 dTDP-4-dehydrorhamnose reductase [Pseudomonas putida]TCP75515.1 dTDP-4-dehydrorhamnose reductase [Pseudomonas putida]HDS0916921.1 dTDP-4-dehydrorhamnose reductase [Pseudomonas putida]HDS0932562.1 dTDP-4-dehydrorhamnose reductase [Pseudomonas putida]